MTSSPFVTINALGRVVCRRAALYRISNADCDLECLESDKLSDSSNRLKGLARRAPENKLLRENERAIVYCRLARRTRVIVFKTDRRRVRIHLSLRTKRERERILICRVLPFLRETQVPRKNITLPIFSLSKKNTNFQEALASGSLRLVVVLIAAEREFFTPCGSCLDWIMELCGPDVIVGFQGVRAGPIKSWVAEQLMPYYPK